MRRLCGWLWMHEEPKWLTVELRNRRDHGCVRPSDHSGPHACWCGAREAA